MERFIDANGVRFRTVSEGSGAPVLVPTGAGIDFYRNTFSGALLEQLQLIYVEMRGTGGSSGDIEGATFASLADDLDAVRSGLGLERAFVLGHSNHGCIALEYALRHPRHTVAAISVGSGPDFSRAFLLGQQRWAAESTAAQRECIERAQAAVEALDAEALGEDHMAMLRYIAIAPLGWRQAGIDTRPLWGEPSPGLARYLSLVVAQQGLSWNLVPRLREIEVPVLAACGRWDYLCPFELWRDAVGELPRGRFALFEESAHNPQYEEQVRFDEVLVEFCTGVECDPAA